jgi:hypothetical protein
VAPAEEACDTAACSTSERGVDMRFACPEKVQIRTIEEENLFGAHFALFFQTNKL